MKKLKYVKLFENLVSYCDGTDMKDIDVLLKSGMLSSGDFIKLLQDNGLLTPETTALIQIQGMSRGGFGKLTYDSRIFLNGVENLINDDARQQISGTEIIRLSKAEAVAMGARFAWRNLNWFGKFYDLQNGTEYLVEDEELQQIMADFFKMHRRDSDDPHIDETEEQDIETSDEYIELHRAGLVPHAIQVTVHTNYFADDEGLDYDQVGEEYSEELANWIGPNGLKVLKGNVELNGDGDQYYSFGSFTYDIMFNDRATLKIETAIHRNSEYVVTYSITKDGRTVDLQDKFQEFYDEGFADPIHDDNGDLVITQPLDFVIKESGLY